MAILKPAEINDQGAINPIDPKISVRGYGSRAHESGGEHVTGAFAVAGAAANNDIVLPDLSDKVWSVQVADGGQYTGNITIEFDEPPQGGVQAEGTVQTRTQGTDRFITGVTITNRGSGYTSPPGISITASGLVLRDARLVVSLGPAAIDDDGVIEHVWDVSGNAPFGLHDLAGLVSKGQAARSIRLSTTTAGKKLVVVYANPTS